MLPGLALIVKCPACGGYFFYERARHRDGDDYSSEFDEALEVVRQEGIPEDGIYRNLAETIVSKCQSKDTSVGLVSK